MTEIVIGSEDDGLRLDKRLSGPLGSRARAQRLIDAGQVLVDGLKARSSHRLKLGERVSWQQPDQVPPERVPVAAAAVPIVYSDDHLLVVDKPAGLVVHPAPGHRSGTLVQLLAERVAGGDDRRRAGLVHRLDRDTSGLLVLARNERAHAALKAQIEARTVERRYIALVEGRPQARSGTIDAPIGRDRRDRMRQSLATDSPRVAITHFQVIEALATSTLLDVRLQTGRTHQIRVHMQAIGHPVCGDPLYGHAGLNGLERQFLHAAQLSFSHPVDGRELSFTSVLPVDLKRALAAARGSR